MIRRSRICRRIQSRNSSSASSPSKRHRWRHSELLKPVLSLPNETQGAAATEAVSKSARLFVDKVKRSLLLVGDYCIEDLLSNRLSATLYVIDQWFMTPIYSMRCVSWPLPIISGFHSTSGKQPGPLSLPAPGNTVHSKAHRPHRRGHGLGRRPEGVSADADAGCAMEGEYSVQGGPSGLALYFVDVFLHYCAFANGGKTKYYDICKEFSKSIWYFVL